MRTQKTDTILSCLQEQWQLTVQSFNSYWIKKILLIFFSDSPDDGNNVWQTSDLKLDK